ncbi:NUDIX domain-containing protein [Actinopolymorpha alba]|uniref:NUDIX domain-containing protein n=1 Tax=Actinopolymorpha alba TaxID=533267 RepID=UPI0003817E43|nr:NUDIX domain-containing protein [Actinopolymorpha alba]
MSGLHADAVTVLSAWEAPNDHQEALRRHYLEYLAQNADGVWRSCRPSHLTAGMIILDHDGRHTLLVLHGRINLWVQPGGHCEPGDRSLMEVAEREAREETGLAELVLDAKPIALSRHRSPCGAETHLDVQYLGTSPAGAAPVVSDESHDVRWFPVSALPGELASGVAESVATAVAALVRR